MSARTRANRYSKPGVASVRKPGRFDRKHDTKAMRRQTHMMLAELPDGEDLALPRPHRTTVDVSPEEFGSNSVARKKLKFWKTKDWKRRTAVRQQRVQMLRDLQAG